MKFRFLTMSAIAVIALAGCKESASPKDPLQVPQTYDTISLSTNAAAELQLRTQLADLVTLLKTGRTSGTEVDLASMTNAIAPLMTHTASTYVPHVGMAIEELANASGGTYDPRRTVIENGQGGVYGGYLFDETGVEMEQIVEKGLFGAMLYHRATQLMTVDATEADVDRILVLYGADPTFPNTDKASSPDRCAAAYAARRDKNDGNGFYTKIAEGLRKAKAAAKAGNAYDQELMEAFTVVRQNWERAIAATVLNYLQSAAGTWSSTSPTDASIASALHAYGEAVGFLRGLRALPASSKIIRDDVIDDLLTKLRAPMTGETSPYAFVTTPVTTLPDVASSITGIAAVYGFTSADLADFRNNWVTVQNRK